MSKKSKKFWRFRASADNPKSADLLLYGPISNTSWLGDEVTPKQFAEDLKSLGDIDILNVFINSDGGDAFAGQAIHSQLKRFRNKAKVNVYIDGLAASAASIIAMAGETIYMPRNAMMMIHNAWTIAIGYADELRKVADMLDQFRETMIAVYREKTGLSDEKIIELLDAETWMTAEEAVELGFADEIEEARSVAASLRGDDNILAIGGQEVLEFDLSRFKRFPKERISRVTMPAASAVGSGITQDNVNESEGRVIDLELTTEILAEKYPDIYSAVKKLGHEEGRKAGYDEGVKAERERMKAIDEIAVPGAEEIVKKAKYETGADAATVAIEIIRAEKAKGHQYLAAVRDDAKPLNEIKPDSVPDADEKMRAEKEQAKKAFAKGANAKRS